MVHLGFMLSLLRYFFVLSFLAPTMVKAALLFLFLDLAYNGGFGSRILLARCTGCSYVTWTCRGLCAARRLCSAHSILFANNIYKDQKKKETGKKKRKKERKKKKKKKEGKKRKKMTNRRKDYVLAAWGPCFPITALSFRQRVSYLTSPLVGGLLCVRVCVRVCVCMRAYVRVLGGCGVLHKMVVGRGQNESTHHGC